MGHGKAFEEEEREKGLVCLRVCPFLPNLG